VKLRRYVALGLGALFIWWGIQGGFLVESAGAMVFGGFTGGFIAALGAATDSFDGAVESVIALGVVVVVAGSGLVGWTFYRYGVDAVWLAGDAVGIVAIAVVKRQNFVLPVLLGGVTGGFVNDRYLPARSS
jgi:hypothetical protein